MTAFYCVVATTPFALYLLALAWRLARVKPRVADARSDLIALAAALVGVFFVGPGQLMAPWGACAVWNAYVWVLVAALYFLAATFVATVARTRLVVYNASRASLRSALTLAALELDADARWEGASMNLPNLDVQFYVDERGLGRVASIVALRCGRSAAPWTNLARELKTRLKETTQTRSWGWTFFAALGVALLAVDCAYWGRSCDDIIEAARFYLSV